MSLQDIFTTDGPGYTDHLKVDIKAHRSIARINRWIAVIALVGGVVYASAQSDSRILLSAVIVFLVCNQLSTTLRLEALEWEQQRQGDE